VGCRVTFWALGKASGLNAAPLQRGPGREGASASQSRRNAGRASQPPKTFLNAGPRPVEVPNPTHRGFGPVSAHCERKKTSHRRGAGLPPVLRGRSTPVQN
jgi:hypothetical protein